MSRSNAGIGAGCGGGGRGGSCPRLQEVVDQNEFPSLMCPLIGNINLIKDKNAQHMPFSCLKFGNFI